MRLLMSLIAFIALHISSCFAKELTASQFQKEVLGGDNVWMVEFYSGMCGSCTEFAPVFSSIESSVQTIKTGKLDIDKEENLNIAIKLNLLEAGIPNIQLITGYKSRHTLMSGDLLSKKEILQKARELVKGFPKNEEGYLLKSE